jgi:NADH-ubiquinone oxidoreductase chain 6
MHNLFLVLDNITNGFSIYTLEFIYISSIFCAIFVIINKNPILSVLFLIALFLIISIYLILLGLNFLGLSYLLVYVGAVSILFLFILMLINIRISELSTDTRNSYPLGIIAFIIFYSFISVIIPINMQQINILDLFNESTNLLNENNPLIYSISNTWDGNLVENFHINTLGNIIYTNYLIWLIISSIILLLAMIGSIVITIKKSD